MKVPSFHPSTYGTSFRCCMASMDVIQLLGYLYKNGILTSLIYPMMHWEGCQHLYGWLELMVHHTSSKASGPIFCRIYKPPHNPQGGLGCDTRYKWIWMGYHIFHMPCGGMRKVSHAWNVTDIHVCPPSRPQTTKYVGPGLVGSAKPPSHPHGSVDCDTSISDHGWMAIYFTFLVNAWERSHKPGM